MLQKIILFALVFGINSIASAEQTENLNFECQPAELTDLNRFELSGQVLAQSETSFQGLFSIKTFNAGPNEQSEEISSHVTSGKVTFFPAGTLYIQDTWLLQSAYQLSGKELKLSLLIDAKNFTSSTVEIDGRIFYAKCLRTF